MTLVVCHVTFWVTGGFIWKNNVKPSKLCKLHNDQKNWDFHDVLCPKCGYEFKVHIHTFWYGEDLAAQRILKLLKMN